MLRTSEAIYRDLIVLSLTAPTPELFCRAANHAKAVKTKLSKDAQTKIERQIELKILEYETNYSKCLNKLVGVV